MPQNMCCPYCGNRNLKSIHGKDPDYDVDVTAWNCLSCDATFRDPDDTRRLIKGERTTITVMRCFYVIVIIAATIGAAVVIDLFGGFLVGVVGGLITWGAFKLAKRAVDRRIEKLEADLNSVETGMRRFVK